VRNVSRKHEGHRLAQLNEIVYQVGNYDAMALAMTLGLDDYFRREYTKFLNNTREKFLRILDVGCGTGRNVPYILSKYKDVNIVLVDISFSSLKIALEKYRGSTNIDYVCCSAELMCLREGSIDNVLSSYMLRHVDIAKFVRELKFITHRFSRIVIVDFWRSHVAISMMLLILHLAIIVPFLSLVFSPRSFCAYVNLWKFLPNLPDPIGICKVFSRLGNVKMLSFYNMIYVWVIQRG